VHIDGTIVTGGPLMSTLEQRAFVLRWFPEIDRRSLHAADAFIAANYVGYNPPIPDLASGREGVRQASRLLVAASSDTAHVIEDPIPEGDKMITRVRVHGTFLGEFLGPDVGLPTITGPGGMGETRLAVTVATELGGPVGAGVMLVEPARLRHAESVPSLAE
jgi:hypothetical protein